MPPTRAHSPAPAPSRPSSPASRPSSPASPHRPAAAPLPSPDTGEPLRDRFGTTPRSVSAPKPVRASTAPTPAAAYKGPSPADLRECLTRHVFPVPPRSPLLMPDGTVPLSIHGADVDLAIAQAQFRAAAAAAPRIRVQHHAHLASLLFDEVHRVKARPGPGASGTDYAKRVAEWHTEAEDCAAYSREPDAHPPLFEVVVEHVNDFLSVRRNYEPTRAPVTTAGWMRPSARDASSPGDWLCYSDEKPRAALKFKHLFTDRDLDQILLAASAEKDDRVGGAIPLSHGFEVWVNDEERVCNSGTLGGNAAKACLLAWSDAHYYRTRWTVLFNGRRAIVCYLAKPDTLFVSSVIHHDAGLFRAALTPTLMLFALATIDRRPSITMSNEALKFYQFPG
ncbi:hypothetical protein Q8F55_002198 [Vanrija albida]|uniref:Uncharacterized protein n=1 Tax=Vanrija albida TaxID=181172 RepID=A0ABR3Q9R1_9TREE